MTFSPCPKPISPPKAPKIGVRKKNAARSADNFKRCYHSRARQKFVNLLECSACGVWGYSQNAHVLGNDGGSRKGHYTTVAPLCGIRPGVAGVYPGCHYLFDEKPDLFRELFPRYSPNAAARATERLWKAFCAGDSA
jgi:hypothetical protein